MNTSIRVRLSVMMFLQYSIWAAWYVTMGRYLGGTLNIPADKIGLAYNSTALAAMISPFFIGMVADRFFSTERILAVLHILGGVLMFLLAQATTFGTFYPLLIAHTLCYMPTLALTNSISFHLMQDPGKEFPRIRVLGTISWIITVWAVGQFSPLDVTTPLPFMIAGGASLLMGVYCLTLPHTPPTPTGKPVTVRDVLGLDALALMKERSFLVFVVSAFLICIPLAFYFAFAPQFLGDMDMPNATQKTVLGQVSEIFFMVVMPWFFLRLGVKYMLVVGMFAWGARYLLFWLGYDLGVLWPLYLGIILHGICYDFFFVTAYIYVDKKASESIRAKAQGFIAFVTLGAGMFVGASLSGVITNHYNFPRVEPARVQQVDDLGTWAAGNFAHWEENGQAAYGRILTIMQDGSTVTGGANTYVGTTNNPVATLEVFERQPSGGFAAGNLTGAQPLAELSRPISRWDKIWLWPGVGALLVMVLFAISFKEKILPQKSDERPV
ncbi:MAG: MFS transporter [Verrucomicrobia bacterium]|nr:MFS transporter [Verrucomicrobiota bacterium]